MNEQEIERIKAYIGKAKYGPTGQMIFAVNEEDGLQLLVDVRGWGRIQNMFPTIKEAEAFQDSVGEFITDAINTALSQQGEEKIDETILQLAIDTWGVPAQCDMVQEECMELAMALHKLKRVRGDADKKIENVIDEIADVKIMILQAERIFGKEKVNERVKFKMKRVQQRLKEGIL